MMCATQKTNSPRSVAYLLLVGLLAFAGAGCGLQGDTSDPETDEFRAALVSQDDVSMSYGAQDDSRSSGLNGEVSGIAALTADAVVGTNVFLGRHIRLMETIVSLPPAVSEEDRRVWEGTHDEVFLRVEATRSDIAQGTRYDYEMRGRAAGDDDAEMLGIFDGHVVRVDHPTRDKQGWGVLRYDFTNLNTLQPDREIGGKARATFRRMGRVRQVRVRLLNVVTPERPDFPEAAAYEYTLLPNRAGELRWFAKADFNKDGQKPLEKIAVHSAWRADLSGAGVGVAMGGSLAVDHLSAVECWNRRAHKLYGYVGWPGGQTESGERSSCLKNPEGLDEPVFHENLPDEDPQIPPAHPEE